MNYNQQHWIKEIQAGNKEVFSEIYECYVDEIYRFISRKINDQKTIEDLTSDVFYKAFKNLKKSCQKEPINIKARMYTIARNTVYDYWRKKNETTQLPDYELQDDNSNITEDIHNEMFSDTIINYIKSLDDDVSDLFIMRVRQQLSYKEITDIN